MIKIRLDADSLKYGSRKRVTLMLKDKIRRAGYFKKGRSVLPNEIKVTLPATGKLHIMVFVQPKIAKGKRYCGGDSLSLWRIARYLSQPVGWSNEKK